jgi:hypothetical protein
MRKIKPENVRDMVTYFAKKYCGEPEIESLAEINFDQHPTETQISQFRDWVTQHVDDKTWSQAVDAVRQKRYRQEKKKHSITIGDEAYRDMITMKKILQAKTWDQMIKKVFKVLHQQ